MRPPASIARTSPSQGLPVETAVENPATAPMSIMPSTPRFRTPARSAKISPIAANSRTVPRGDAGSQDDDRIHQPPVTRSPGRGVTRRHPHPPLDPHAIADDDVGEDEAEQDDPLIIAGTPDGWISRPARISAPNRIDATITPERPEPGEVGDDDRGVAVAG